jgi:UDP-N-acetyl-D-glucosamine dehydrogenase
MSKTLKDKIQNKKANIAVLGLGYVGLPLAVSFAKKGFQVFGLDMDAGRVERVQTKKTYIADVALKELRLVVDGGRLKASTDFSLLKTADVIIICVPTPLRRKYTPDVSFIVNAVKTIDQYIKKDTLVILESTTYPGTTRELILPVLEKSGMKIGKGLYLSFSPERIDPGNKKFPVTQIPKIVGGVDEISGKLTKILYETIIKEVHLVSSADAAEMTKLLENSFRIVNIGWINELAMMCHKLGIDIWEVIAAAKTKPFGFMPFYPGLGVGGHCIPDDPLYLHWKARKYGFNSKYIKLSADTNSHMPHYAVGRIEEILIKNKKNLKGSRILIIGVTYKKDVKDLRKSPPLRLIELLEQRGVNVAYSDPFIPYLKIGSIDMQSVAINEKNIAATDGVIIATDHSEVNYQLILKSAKMIFDTRNVFGDIKNKKVVKL